MKNNKFSRRIALLLVAAMAAGMVSGCGAKTTGESASTESSTTPAGNAENPTENVEEELSYPLTGGAKLSWYVRGNLDLNSEYLSYNDSPFHSGLSKVTGVDIDWQFTPAGAERDVAYNLLLQSDKLPNIISGTFTSDEVAELLEDGLIYDLSEYLPTYAPDYWAYVSAPENNAILMESTTDAGQVFGIASIRESNFNVTYRGPVIRQDWLDECGLEAPVTLEDWENVLVAFNEKYGAKFGFALNRFEGGGISSGTGAHAALYAGYYVDENGEVQCANAQPEWKEMLEVLHRWYDMGLIDPDFATMTDEDLRTKVLNNEVGVSYTAMSQLTNWIADAELENTGANWVGFEYARTKPGAPTVYIDTTYSLVTANNYAVITTSCSEEELINALKLLNYGYTEEGIMYWNFGTEGVSYTIDANGKPQWTDLVVNDPSGLSNGISKYSGAAAAPFSIQTEDFVKTTKAEAAVDAVYKWIDNTEAQKYVLPSTTKSVEDASTCNDIKATLWTYVAEMALKFVTGDESLDNFDDFVKSMDQKGLQELLEIEQEAYNRFLSR